MKKALIGKVLFTVNAVVEGGGGVLADMNHTHMFNPRWPPHAEFHDGQNSLRNSTSTASPR